MKAGGANGEKEMKKIRAHRVSGIVLYAMLAMTVVVAVLFFFGGEVPMAGRVVADVSQSEPRYTDALLCWVYALLGLAVVVALGTALRKQVLGFVNAPGAMVRLWVGAGLLVALLGGAWLAGSGEPLDNYDNVMRAIEILVSDWGFGWSPKRITVSTIGVLPALRRFLDESRCHIAVSLHNPFPDERLSIMPVQKAYPIEDVVALLKQYDFSGQRRVSFEYTMFFGFNDTKRHADALARMLSGLECRVNLIRFHKIPDFPYTTSPEQIIRTFQERLERAGIVTTIRASRGEDILAACGLLAGRHAE